MAKVVQCARGMSSRELYFFFAGRHKETLYSDYCVSTIPTVVVDIKVESFLSLVIYTVASEIHCLVSFQDPMFSESSSHSYYVPIPISLCEELCQE